jgi:hypothetical protein
MTAKREIDLGILTDLHVFGPSHYNKKVVSDMPSVCVYGPLTPERLDAFYSYSILGRYSANLPIPAPGPLKWVPKHKTAILSKTILIKFQKFVETCP